jgi:hypothetical protein
MRRLLGGVTNITVISRPMQFSWLLPLGYQIWLTRLTESP